MNFLDNLVMLQSGANLTFLHNMLIIAQVIFLVYSGTLLISTILSVAFSILAKRKNNKNYYYLSKDYIDLITTNKIFGFGMGVVPFISIILLYTQLLSGTNAPVVPYLLLSFVLFVVSLTLIHIYQHSTDLGYIFGYLKRMLGESQEDREAKEFISFKESNENLSSRTGFWGAVLLFISLRLFITSTVHAVQPDLWESSGFLSFLAQPSAILACLNFITISAAITGVALLIKKYEWESAPKFQDAEYLSYARKYNMGLALIFTAVQPIFFMLNIATTPLNALSFALFGLTIAALIVMAIVAHIIYYMFRKDTLKYINISFYAVLALFMFTVVKNQYAFNISNQEHVAELADKYDVHEQELLAAMGQGVEEISGEEIYKAKCTACHAFDKKIVGPPHKEVLPKYIGKESELAKFILNPVKVNPAYPAMANQGLKPKEAKAVAQYMLETLGPKLEGKK